LMVLQGGFFEKLIFWLHEYWWFSPAVK